MTHCLDFLDSFSRKNLAALLAISTALPAVAQSAQPDSGQTLRQMQQPLHPNTLPLKPSLSVPTETGSDSDVSQRFLVSTVHIQGNTQVDSEELQQLFAPLTGREVSLTELRRVAAGMTELYRKRGFVVSRAFVPAQEIRDGVVEITVIEGSLSSTSVLNDSVVHGCVLDAVVAAQGLHGRAVKTHKLDRELLLIADLPAVGAVNGMLKPGKEVGTSDLVIAVGAGKTHEGDISLDNYGNRYTGQARLNSRIDFNSPAGIGDRLGLRATYTNEKLLYGRALYDLPVNGDGWRAGASLSSSHYALGREFERLDADGTASTVGLQTNYPLVRGLNANIWLRGAIDYRKLKDNIHATSLKTRKSVSAGTVEVYGDLSDAIGGGAYNTWRANVLLGKLDIATPTALTADRLGPHADGSYHKIEFGATRLQAIKEKTSAFISVAGQRAQKNLDSSEKFVLGGMYGVRAYPQGEGVGDDAWLANVEIHHSISAGVQFGVFYDYGHVHFNHTQYVAGINSVSLRGAGLNLGVRYATFHVKTTLAWRHGQTPTSAPDHRPRLWLVAGNSF